MTDQSGDGAPAAALINPQVARRTLLRGAAALSGLAAVPASTFANSARTIRYVVIDSRFRQSAAFGEVLARDGAEVLDLASGLTAIWQDRLVPEWRGRGGVVAGLTTRSAWDGLSQQALGQFRKPRILGDHRFDGVNAAMSHRLNVPSAILGSGGTRQLQSPNWAATMAVVARDCATRASGLPRQSCQIGRHDAALPGNNQLFSWMVV